MINSKKSGWEIYTEIEKKIRERFKNGKGIPYKKNGKAIKIYEGEEYDVALSDNETLVRFKANKTIWFFVEKLEPGKRCEFFISNQGSNDFDEQKKEIEFKGAYFQEPLKSYIDSPFEGLKTIPSQLISETIMKEIEAVNKIENPNYSQEEKESYIGTLEQALELFQSLEALGKEENRPEVPKKPGDTGIEL